MDSSNLQEVLDDLGEDRTDFDGRNLLYTEDLMQSCSNDIMFID